MYSNYKIEVENYSRKYDSHNSWFSPVIIITLLGASIILKSFLYFKFDWVHIKYSSEPVSLF